MNKITLSLLLCSIAIITNGQILKVATTPASISSQVPAYSQVTTINTKTFSYTPATPNPTVTPIDGDSTTEDNLIYDYASIIPVSILTGDGNVTTTSLGKVWTLRISVPNALNIGVTFNQFNLSTAAEMYIFNDSRTVLDSAIKKSHFTNSSTVSITSIKGNAIIIYILERNNFGALQSTLSIQKLQAGYLDVKEVSAGSGSGLARPSLNCDPMIQCQQDKITHARAVARMQVPVSSTTVGLCTGTLINNEANNGRPLLLTAFHCLDHNGNGIIDASEAAYLSSAVFQFRFWRPTCNGTVITTGIEFSGAVLRASSKATDVLLLELTNPPGIGDDVNYAGWNRQTGNPSDYGSFIIHHPQAEDMRITNTSSISSWFFNSNYWSAHYAIGTVDKGSSGSALINPTGQIVGQLRSGWSNCNFTNFGDRYGKFDRSWTNASLQAFLSPSQNAQAVNLLNLAGISITGPSVIACTTPTQFNTYNLLDVTYQWSVSAGLQIISGQGTPTLTVSGLSSNQYGSGIITLTLNSINKGRIRTKVITKNITINTGGAASGTYNSPLSNNQTLISPANRFDMTTFNNSCIAMLTNMNIPSGASVVWNGSTSSPDVIWQQTGNDVVCYFTALNQTADLTISVTTSCGTKNTWFRFKCTSIASCGGISPSIVILPNPATSRISVSFAQNGDNILPNRIKEIRILDKMGNVYRKIKYTNALSSATVDISALKQDVYTILVFDGKIWVSKKIIKN